MAIVPAKGAARKQTCMKPPKKRTKAEEKASRNKRNAAKRRRRAATTEKLLTEAIPLAVSEVMQRLPQMEFEAIAEFNRTRRGSDDATWQLIGSEMAEVLGDAEQKAGAKIMAAQTIIGQRKVEVDAQKALLDSIRDRLQGQRNDEPQIIPGDDDIAVGYRTLLEHVDGNREQTIPLESQPAPAVGPGSPGRPRRSILGSAVVVDGQAGCMATEGTDARGDVG